MAEGINDFIGGWVGGAAGILVGSPLDVVKVLKSEILSFGKARIQAPNLSKANQHTGSFNMMTNMIRAEGMKSLFKGLLASVMGLAGLNGVLYTSYGIILRRFEYHESSEPTLSQVMVAGGGAGMACFLFSTPTELIKIQAQVSTVDKASSQVAKEIFFRNGLSGFYQGGWITLAREVPGYGFYFGVYEGMKRAMDINSNDEAVKLLFSGGMAGAVSWGIIYPIDVIKSRIQMQIQGANLTLKVSPLQMTPRPYTSIKDCIIRSYKAEGVRAFYRGFTPTVLKGFPVGAITFWVYENVMEFLS